MSCGDHPLMVEAQRRRIDQQLRDMERGAFLIEPLPLLIETIPPPPKPRVVYSWSQGAWIHRAFWGGSGDEMVTYDIRRAEGVA